MPFIERWGIIIVIFLFTFPLYFVDYDIGLDASYIWGLNWLFVHDYETLKNLIYPFGPLAFLKIPTVIGHNLFFQICFFSILKIGFIWLMLKLSDVMQNNNKFATLFITFIVSFFANIDFLIMGCCLILMLLCYKKNNLINFIISVFIAFIGLFIKISIGISAFSVIGIFMGINLFYSRSIIQLIKQLGIIFSIGFVAGMVVFGSVNIYFHFLVGAYKLTGGYGDTLSLHPNNNWLLLFPFLILMIIFPFICKEKDVRITYLLSLFLLFAAWKHSFIREDIYHYRVLLTFLFVFWGIIFIASSSKKMITLLFASVTILLLYANMRNIPMYKPIEREITGINNFTEILKYKAFKQRMLDISENNISSNKLVPELLEVIGDATIDVYPWEFSYIAANHFKWKPRKTLGMKIFAENDKNLKYAENADYGHSFSSPQFVLFHISKDIYHGYLSSIDNRYILNDEPLLIYNLLNNYTLTNTTDKFMLFEKDTISHFEDIYLEEFEDNKFGEWIDIPYYTNEMIRLNVHSSNTFLGKLNKMVYKETAYFIDYQFENDEILTYRYVPQTAVDGLWCNPFIRTPNPDEIESKVVKVRLRNANPLLVKNVVKTQIQHIKTKKIFLQPPMNEE